MEFIEAPTFTKYLHNYLTESEFADLQQVLLENPEAGDLIQGTGGFRKVRWLDARRGKGKRGGLRIIYYYFPDDHQIWLLTLYDKSEASDLTRQQKNELRLAIELEKQARKIMRAKRR